MLQYLCMVRAMAVLCAMQLLTILGLVITTCPSHITTGLQKSGTTGLPLFSVSVKLCLKEGVAHRRQASQMGELSAFRIWASAYPQRTYLSKDLHREILMSNPKKLGSLGSR